MPAHPTILARTGADIAREAGLATIGGPGGVQQRLRTGEAAMPEAVVRDPARLHASCDARRARSREPGIVPDAADLAPAGPDRHGPAFVADLLSGSGR